MNKRHKPKFGLLPPPDDYEAYVLGGNNLPAEILQSDADWKEYLPLTEMQLKRSIESYDCTAYAILNAIEMFLQWMLEHGRLGEEQVQWLIQYGYIKKRS